MSSLTTEHLADQLGVSVRTVLRDLNWLRDAGFPLVVQRGRHGGVTLRYRLRPLTRSAEHLVEEVGGESRLIRVLGAQVQFTAEYPQDR
ncbi:HTH domain-containing protein, partial [Nocardia farcinica]|uniref:HTH domain-containing protein n=1 Tax=Nocardia farcinica TaxID=37329 RepID=UPI003CC800A2